MESEPRRFDDRQAAQAWLTSTFEPWRVALSEAERQAVSAYKLDAYEPINASLRYGGELGDEDEWLIENLDSALAQFRLPEPIVVYRGLVQAEVRVAPIGEEFIELAYFSTTLIRGVAMGMISSEPADIRLLAEITVPGGSRVGAFVGAPDLVRDMAELEILLPRSSRFRITGRIDPEYIELEAISR